MSESLKIYGLMLSQPMRSVLAYCKLSNVPYEYHEVGIVNHENLGEEFTKINPFQQVPAIVHGDYNLWESPAIVAYIADAFNVDNQWYPKDIKLRGKVNAYLHWHHQGCRVPVLGYVGALFIGPKIYGRPEITPEGLVPIKATLDQYFETLKWQISETGFVARTPEASIADIFAYSEIMENYLIGFDISTVNEEVQAWFAKIAALPFIEELHEEVRAAAIRIREAQAT